MPENKRPVPRKSAKKAGPVDDDDALAQSMADLALDVSVPEGDDDAAVDQKDDDLTRMVQNALRKQNDAVLYDAIERARFTDVSAYQLLRMKVEEHAGAMFVRRDDAPVMEINAFAIPLFVHATGGLEAAEAFNDADAFDQLVESFRSAGLESPDAKVMLVSHAYTPDEASRITYSQLHQILRGVYASMSAKKLVAVPALEASMGEAQANGARANEPTVELRFLLGFALKRADDPFYAFPEGEAAMEEHFDARMERYRVWTEQAAPLVRRCLVADPASVEISFLYQDLVFGAFAQGFGELETLRMMSQLNQAMEASGTSPQDATARVAPAAGGDDLVLRITLLGKNGMVLKTVEKPLDVDEDVEAEMEDVRDALGAIGITAVVDDSGE